MTFAYFCVLIAMLMPLACAAYAKKVGGFTLSDNRDPRAFLAKTEGEAARANAAQQNSFEAFAPFAAAVIIAHATGEASQFAINFWALVFIVSRVVFIYMYVRDKALFRSLSWLVGLFSIIMLFVVAF
ncbi:MAG: MAPEG family protein [Conchiformibius sp.]|nr:MAPEG family protein [Conchiformibius sp.]